MIEVTDEEFESMMMDAIDSIPDEFTKDLENVYFTWEHGTPIGKNGGIVLGQYYGAPLTSRSALTYGAYSTSPDKITLYKDSLQQYCNSYDELKEQIRKTTVHEVAHYFGMDEDQVRAMGY